MNFYFAIMLLWQEAINFAWVLFIIFKIYLSESYTEWKRKKRRCRGERKRGERRGRTLLPLVHSHNGWPGRGPGQSRSPRFLLALPFGQRNPSTWASSWFFLPLGTLPESWIEVEQLRLEAAPIWDIGTVTAHLDILLRFSLIQNSVHFEHA